MLKALLLQQMYDLSDPALEEALLDRVSFRRFCGFALDAATPDERTLCRFRNALKDAGLGEALFQEVLRQLEGAGFVLKTGTLIDATLVRCAVRPLPPGSTPRDQESRAPHDPDANWTREGKARRLFFGYKAHIGIDQGSGLIRSRALTGAKTYESQDLREPRLTRAKTCESQDLRERGRRCARHGRRTGGPSMLTKPMRNTAQARGSEGARRQGPYPASTDPQPKAAATLAERAQQTDRPHPRRHRAHFLGAQTPLRPRTNALPRPKANAFHLDLTAIAFNLRTIAAKSR
jgi:transposase, IS5 family